jgi:hypothetical protein
VAVQPKAEAAKFATLDVLFRVTQDNTVSQADRRQAASQAAQFFLPKNPRGKTWRRRKFPADECGFAVDPELARELRDAKLKIANLPLEKKRTPYALARKVSALQARMNEIQQSLQCPCPSKYGWEDIGRDVEQLKILRQARVSGTVFSPEVDLKEAIRTARFDSFVKGPEIAATVLLKNLQEKQRIADQGGPQLNAVERVNFRFLSLLYMLRPPSLPDEEMLEGHPFQDPPFFVGNPNYPDGYLICSKPPRL